MKLVHSSGDAFVQGGALIGGSGLIKLNPETIEDLWHAYNLVLVGNSVTAYAVRKVKQESSTGSVDTQRVKVMLTITVKSVDFDPEGGELRLSGVVTNDVEGVRHGAHHTLLLELNRAFSLYKDAWDSVALERLRESISDDASRADLWAVLIKDGLAQLCLVTDGMTIVKAKLETHIQKKGTPQQLLGANKSRTQWFKQLLEAILRHVDFEALRVVILAGPGFTKDTFWEWLLEEASKRQLRDLIMSKPKWVLTHASSAYKHALNEVMRDPAVAHRVAETRAGAEVRVLREFMQLMDAQPDRVTYGPRHVKVAAEQGAIDKLLLVDSLFRAQHVGRRAEYVGLVESVKATGSAAVHIFSDKHPSGEQLGMLSGVAAILRFPLAIDDLLEEEDEQESSDEDDSASNASASDEDGDRGDAAAAGVSRLNIS